MQYRVEDRDVCSSRSVCRGGEADVYPGRIRPCIERLAHEVGAVVAADETGGGRAACSRSSKRRSIGPPMDVWTSMAR